MLIKAIALRFGYVESTALSWLVFAQDPYEAQKFPTSSKEALYSLVELLYQKVGPLRTKSRSDLKQCCNKALGANPDNEFCSKCGNHLRTQLSLTEWSNFIWKLGSNTIDDFGYCDSTENPYGWDASQFWFGIPDQQMVIVHAQAEKILTLALFDLHPELIDLIDDPDQVPVMGPENYLWEDYQKLLTDPVELVPLEGASTTTIIYDYPNGAQVIVKNNQLDYIKYGTGDQTWFKDGQPDHGFTHNEVGWNNEDQTVFSGQVQSR